MFSLFFTRDFLLLFLGVFIIFHQGFFTIVFGCFHCWLQLFISQAFFTLYCCTMCATDFRELFFTLGRCYLTLFPNIWPNLLLSRLPWESAVLPWRLQGLSLRFGAQVQRTCLFESHSVLQKMLVSRFYFCVKALRNTISTFQVLNPLFDSCIHC